jgi:hypothetical protein
MRRHLPASSALVTIPGQALRPSGSSIDSEANGNGSVFQMTPAGNVTTLHKFIGGDGINPSMLIEDTSRVLYGVTEGGGDVSCGYDPSFGCGTIFSLDVGLDPFVETVPSLGAVGASVILLGTNFEGVKSVDFGGTSAQFTLESNSEIPTTVPPGAKTGNVTVAESRGTLVSNTPFTVTK